MKKRLVLATVLGLLAGEKSFPQTTKIQENTNHQIVTTFAEKSNKQDKTTYVIKSGNKDKDYQYTPEVDHATIISMGLNNIISTYGPQEGLQMIRSHLLQEINTLRMNHGLSSLKESNSLAVSAQKHAEFLHQHASLYDFATIGKTKNPHIEYDNSYTTINTPGARARTQGYEFSLIKENISIMQFVLPNASYSISDIISERMGDEGHKNNILSTTQDIGIGFADGLVVVDFAQ